MGRELLGRWRPIWISLWVAVIWCVGGGRTASAQVLTATVTGGAVRGVVADGVASFKGVPFAAPPVGPLRWRAPQPVQPWTGVREADAFGPAPMQFRPGLDVAAAAMGVAKVSEDCLYLNVWTAAKRADERRPVMVWIYGGAFALGSTGTPVYDGARLARAGVVVVSVGYRVGPFGFLAHPELSRESGHGSGCYGIQDQIAGLRWVRANAAQFGGDPARVTIFGESAGGESVNLLAASPAAAGLFDRAISESGGLMAPPRRGDDERFSPGPLALPYAEAKGVKFLADLGAKDIAAARALPADAIQKVRLEPCWPVADGPTVPGDLYEAYDRGQFNDTPVLLGTNSNDGAMFAAVSSTPAAFERLVRGPTGTAPNADALSAAYPHATAAQASRANRQLVRDWIFAWPTWAWARQQARRGHGRAFLYYYDYTSPPSRDGAGHTAEVPYVFGHLGGLFYPAASKPNVAMSDRLIGYWTNFAATGDPNGPGLLPWPAFDERSMATMTFAPQCSVGPTPNAEQLRAVDGVIAAERARRRPAATAP